MRTSETFNELAAALAKAQGAIENAEKDRSNPFLGNRYMTLTAVWDAIRKPLSDNGLSIVQVTEAEDGAVMLLTRLMHSSGQYIEATYPVLGMDAKGVNAAQAAGSALTYARRYSLTSMIGVVADEDDDASAATGKQQAKPAPKQAPAPTQRQPPQPAASQPTPSAGPVWTQDAANDAAFEQLPSASAERNGGSGKTTPANGAHDPAAPWDDNRKAEAVRWAMRRYPEVYGHVKPWQLSLDHLLEKAASEGMDSAQIAQAWKDKCAAKQDELDAKKLQAELDAQAAAQS